MRKNTIPIIMLCISLGFFFYFWAYKRYDTDDYEWAVPGIAITLMLAASCIIYMIVKSDKD